MPVQSRSLAISHAVLTWLLVLNLVFALLFAIFLGLSFFLDEIAPRLNDPRELLQLKADLPAIRIVMAIAICTTAVAHLLLKRLRAIVASVRQGTPFLAARMPSGCAPSRGCSSSSNCSISASHGSTMRCAPRTPSTGASP